MKLLPARINLFIHPSSKGRVVTYLVPGLGHCNMERGYHTSPSRSLTLTRRKRLPNHLSLHLSGLSTPQITRKDLDFGYESHQASPKGSKDHDEQNSPQGSKDRDD